MSSETWEVFTIEELIENKTILAHKDGNHGSNYPRTSEFGDEGVPFLTAKLLDDSGNIDLENAPRLSNEKADKFKFGFIETNDVLLSHNATVGRVAVVPEISERVLIGTSLTHYRLDESKLLPKYLAAYFSGIEFQNQLASVMSQTTRNQVPITSQRKLSVVVPPIEEQKRIADMLGSFDDKIRLNRQTNQTLENIAQAIFKSWFVDFEPTRAKIAAKQAGLDLERAAMTAISGKPVAALEYLQQTNPEQYEQLKTTAALFPDALVDSELGEIPEGWCVKNMEELSTIVAMGPFGSNIKVDTFVEDGIPVISGQHLNGTMLEDSTFNYITEEHADKLNKSNVVRGDVVFTHAGSIGQVAYIPEKSKYERYVLSQRQFYMRPDVEQICSRIIVYYFKSHLGQYELLANTSQVGVPSISRPVSNLRKIETVVPMKELSEQFDILTGALHSKIENNLDEIDSLVSVRDSLLPKLLAGEINNIS